MAQKSNTIKEILSQFPKKRISLSSEMNAIHLNTLQENRERQTILSRVSSLLEGWMHSQVARRGSGLKGAILEIGAGTLNHVSLEPPEIDYDAIEPFQRLYENKVALTGIRKIHADINDIDISSAYDRVISVATLEHLTDLPRVVAQSGLLLREGGIFQAGIPSEGGFLWGMSWRLTTAIAFKFKTGLNFSKHMEYEHINDAPEIRQVLRYFFQDVTVRRFPFPFFHFSLYEYVECKNPRGEICRQYLSSD